MGTLGKIFQEVGMPADFVETLMGLIPQGATKPSMKPTLKTLLRLPNLLVFFMDKWFFQPKMRRVLKKKHRQFATIDYRSANEFEVPQLLAEIDRLYDIVQDAAYYNIVGPLLMMMYNRVLSNQLKKIGVDFSQLDLVADLPELSDYDPNYHLHTLNEQFISLNSNIQDKIRQSNYKKFLELPGIAKFQKDVSNFLERFGQFSDNGNDFSATPWRESPDMILELITNFTPTMMNTSGKVRFSDLKSDRFSARKSGSVPPPRTELPPATGTN